MKKESVILMFALIFLSLITIVTASNFIDNQESDFNSGTYFQTEYNTSDNFVWLAHSNTSGNFTSQIFNVGGFATWNNISWFTEIPYGQELPNNQEVETGDFLRGMNMTGNVLLMHFNNDSAYGENDIHVYDFSGNGNNGTLNNGDEVTSSGKLNGAIELDGSNDYVRVADDESLQLQVSTISAWFKTDSVGNGDVLIGKNFKGYELGFTSSSDEISLFYGDGSDYDFIKISSGITIDDNAWHHVTLTLNKSEGEAKLYIDGNYKGTGTGDSLTGESGSDLFIGSRNAGARHFPGSIDEVAIWNRILSAQEILDIYKRGALRLNLSVQSCNDENCEGESWTNLGNNLTSPQTLSESNNQYFQYKFDFKTDNASYSPELYNVSLDYNAYPTTNLISPSNEQTLEGQSQTFTCNATANAGDLQNISLYHNATGTWHLNSTNEVSGSFNETSFTVSGLPYTTFEWNCLATDSNGLSSFADSNFTLTTIADATKPAINSYSITSSLTSGETATIRTNITDSSEISLVWFTINDTDGTLTNYTMSQEGSTDFYNTTFEIGKSGTWQYKVYANDSYGNVNDSMDWQSFSVSAPTATPQNEIYPTHAIPSSSITITADLSATDLLKGVNATLNVPSGFQFPFSNYPQTQEIGNFSELQTQTARWFVYLPNTETTHTFNVTWTDKYNNTFQGDNKQIIVTYDSTNLTNTTNVNTITFPELEAGDVLESEIQVRDINGNFVNASSVKISLYDPNDNLVVDTVNFASQLGTGRYFYNYTTPSTPTGQWLIVVNVTRSGNSFIDREYFRLTGGPFDVRDIEITDSTSPNLGISVILENMGDGVTDIVVDWNLTRTDTGDLLDSGQDTIGVTSEVTHTITPETTYTGEAQITFLGIWSLTEKAGAQETFTITSSPSSDDGDTGGSSGGGGESITGRATEEVVCNPPYIRYGKECCLDSNNNSICDNDETLENPKKENETSDMKNETGDETPKKEIKIYENLRRITSKIGNFIYSVGKTISSNRIYLFIGIGSLILIAGIFLLSRFIIKRKPRDVTRLKSIKGIKVYGGDGHKIGKVKEIYLEEKKSKIYGWLIKVDKNISKKIKKKNILVRHKHIESIKHIMIINKRVSEHLDKLDSKVK